MIEVWIPSAPSTSPPPLAPSQVLPAGAGWLRPAIGPRRVSSGSIAACVGAATPPWCRSVSAAVRGRPSWPTWWKGWWSPTVSSRPMPIGCAPRCGRRSIAATPMSSRGRPGLPWGRPVRSRLARARLIPVPLGGCPRTRHGRPPPLEVGVGRPGSTQLVSCRTRMPCRRPRSPDAGASPDRYPAAQPMRRGRCDISAAWP